VARAQATGGVLKEALNIRTISNMQAKRQEQRQHQE